MLGLMLRRADLSSTISSWRVFSTHYVDLVAHQVAQEGVADVFAVLVTVADDDRALGMR